MSILPRQFRIMEPQVPHHECRIAATPGQPHRPRPTRTEGRARVPQQDAALRDPLRGAMDDPRHGLAAARDRDRRRVHEAARRSTCSARPARRSTTTRCSSTPTSCSSRSPRRRASSTCRRATRRTTCTSAATPWSSARSTARRSCARATSAATATMDDFRNFSKLAQSLLGAGLGGRGRLRAERHAARLAPPRHGLRAADLTDKIYMGNVVSRRNALDTIAMGEILFGGRESIEETPVLHLADQLQLAAALGRPHARRAVRVHRGQPAGHHHAVPADGRDVAGHDPGGAGPADRRGALGHRAVAADPAGRAGGLRLVPVEHRHAVGLAAVRHARVGDRPAVHRARSPGTSGCRSAPAAG